MLIFQTENGSPGDFPKSDAGFAHRANRSLSFVRLLRKGVIRLQTNLKIK